jgi:prophage antirepressor-like protein
MKTNQPAERQNCQITPFIFFVAQDHYKKWSLRIVLIKDRPWFVAVDVASALNNDRRLRNIPENERRLVKTPTAFGWQKILVINKKGLYRIIFRSRPRKSGAEEFRSWILNVLLPQVQDVASMYQFSLFGRIRRFLKSLCIKQKLPLVDLPAKEAQDEQA